MATRKALGRGLSALIPTPVPSAAAPPADGTGSEHDEEGTAPLFVSIARIAPNPSQPRKLIRSATAGSSRMTG